MLRKVNEIKLCKFRNGRIIAIHYQSSWRSAKTERRPASASALTTQREDEKTFLRRHAKIPASSRGSRGGGRGESVSQCGDVIADFVRCREHQRKHKYELAAAAALSKGKYRGSMNTKIRFEHGMVGKHVVTFR